MRFFSKHKHQWTEGLSTDLEFSTDAAKICYKAIHGSYSCKSIQKKYVLVVHTCKSCDELKLSARSL